MAREVAYEKAADGDLGRWPGLAFKPLEQPSMAVEAALRAKTVVRLKCWRDWLAVGMFGNIP